MEMEPWNDCEISLEGIRLGVDIANDKTKTEIIATVRIFPDVNPKDFKQDLKWYHDEFYDTANMDDCRCGKFFRKRTIVTSDGVSTSFVHQISRTLNGRSHLYVETVIEESELHDKEVVIQYSFRRSVFEKFGGIVYLDTVMEPFAYSVISIKQRFCCWDTQAAENLQQCVQSVAAELSREIPAVPMYSKFMMALQLSPYYDICDFQNNGEEGNEFNEVFRDRQRVQEAMRLIFRKDLKYRQMMKQYQVVAYLQTQWFETMFENRRYVKADPDLEEIYKYLTSEVEKFLRIEDSYVADPEQLLEQAYWM